MGVGERESEKERKDLRVRVLKSSRRCNDDWYGKATEHTQGSPVVTLVASARLKSIKISPSVRARMDNHDINVVM